ncbi:RICIN domain-containing protein [Streptomyces murinus]|uniref:RICIN domain-containing protein n=1 Tax=Streptomyces murinus TaxID=33900 RepID=UPI0021149AB0|nr:ricin-type beta-trefoil lectin domain protein [Streptomyces murinus]
MRHMFGRARRLLGPSCGALLAVVLLTPVQDAQAAGASLASFDANFTLTRVDGDKSGLISSVESAGVQNASVTDVIGQHTGDPSLCHGTGLNGALKYDGFCWDSTDDRTGYTDDPAGWMPQGFSGSHDATDDGLYGGRHLYVASWYLGKYADNRPNEQYARISIAQSTGDSVTYGHVALVEPVDGDFRNLTYTSHEDGVAWYGNRLFVANGAELQVYDLTHLWKMSDTGGSGTGLSGGRSSARYHQWALPLLARYTTQPDVTPDHDGHPFRNDDPRACQPGGTGELCLSSLSIDRSSGSPVLVSVENVKAAGGRIVRWPLSQLGSGLPTKIGSEQTGYTTPVWNVQGTATDGHTYYMSGDCPTTWPSGYSCVHEAVPGSAPHVLTQSPWLTESLSYDHNAGRLWGLNEALVDSAGPHRVVFSIDPHAGQEANGYGWLSNFTKPGFVCATPQGDGTADGTPVTVWHCTGAASQRWAYRGNRIVNEASGKCLTPQGDAENTDGALLTLWTCNSAASSQLFFPVNGGTANEMGKGITPKGNSLADGTWLTLWTQPAAVPDVQLWSVHGF